MMLNDGFKVHLIQALKENYRLGKRKREDFRNLKIELGLMSKAEGSAVVSLGDTKVIAGVKLEIAQPFPDTPDEGGISVNMELIPLANPEFESGPPSVHSIEMSRVIDRTIRESKVLDFKKLCIKKGEAAWFIMIDIIPLNDAGNLLDAGAIAAVCALYNTKLPKVDKDNIIDYKHLTSKGLPIKGIPVLVTMHKIGDFIFVDPDLDEERFSDVRLSVASVDKDTLCALQKGGEAPLTADEVLKIVEFGLRKGEEIRKIIKGVLNGKK